MKLYFNNKVIRFTRLMTKVVTFRGCMLRFINFTKTNSL